MKRRRSWGAPVAIVVVLAVVAGGTYLWTQRDDSTDDAGKADTSSSTTTKATATTTAPIAWTPASDPASGLTWTMPGAEVTPIPSLAAGAAVPVEGPSSSWGVGVMDDDPAPHTQVTIWQPPGGADQQDVDDLLRFHHEAYHRGNTPYAKPVTIAGAQATAMDASDDQSSMLEAVAVVGDSLVLVELSAFGGQQADPAVFEQLLASFANG